MVHCPQPSPKWDGLTIHPSDNYNSILLRKRHVATCKLKWGMSGQEFNSWGEERYGYKLYVGGLTVSGRVNGDTRWETRQLALLRREEKEERESIMREKYKYTYTHTHSLVPLKTCMYNKNAWDRLENKAPPPSLSHSSSFPSLPSLTTARCPTGGVGTRNSRSEKSLKNSQKSTSSPSVISNWWNLQQWVCMSTK